MMVLLSNADMHEYYTIISPERDLFFIVVQAFLLINDSCASELLVLVIGYTIRALLPILVFW